MKSFPSELEHNMGATMRLDVTRLLISFKKPQTRKEVENVLRELRLALEDSGSDREEQFSGPFEHVNHTDRRFWTRSDDGRPITDEQQAALEKKLGASAEFIGPVYRLGETPGRGGLLCPLPNVLLLKTARELEAKNDKAQPGMATELGLEENTEKSRYLLPWRYFVLAKGNPRTAYELLAVVRQGRHPQISDASYEHMPMLVPITMTPNDPIFPRQWSMTRIQAAGPGTTGWDISAGAPGVVVGILDTGCDLTHPDLDFASPGVNLGTMAGTGAPVGGAGIIGHGTCCAGNAAGRFNNGVGVAGVAGNCRVLPIAFQNWTDAEVAAGINFAAANGAGVLSMSFGQYAPGDPFGPSGWNFAVIDPAINNAVNVSGMVLVAATGNENTAVANRYPGRHPLVIGVGGSDQADNRKSPASPDGECWGANFGAGFSVVAPCVLNPATDIRGGTGFNNNNGGPKMVACVNYPVSGDAAGDYFFQFNGTSSATPHVAGLAAVIRSQYPALTNLQVRTLIERTAEKVGGVYADAPGFPNGTRNNQMGYGRINLFRALDQADVLIKDWSGDNGVEPSAPPSGDFWDFSDIVLRITDDNVFNPSNPAQSQNVERGQTNYLYVRVTNNGSRAARNVVVNARVTPYVGLEFIYPADWTLVDGMHVSPTPVTNTFATIPAGGSVMAKFTISSTQVEDLWGWVSAHPWHPCLVASVTADNDYAFASASMTGSGLIVRRNNLAQRNLSMIDVLSAGASVAAFPMVAGNRLNLDRFLEVVVDRSLIPKNMRLLLSLDDDGSAFPKVDFSRPAGMVDHCDGGGLVFVERTKVTTKLGCCHGLLTLEKGSRFDCLPNAKIGKVSVQGGELILRDDRRFVEIREDHTLIRMEKQAGQIYPLSLHPTLPPDARNGDQYLIRVSQRDERNETVGGATVIYNVQ